MFDSNTLRAMGKVIARQAREKAPDAAANEVIDMLPLLEPWREGTMESPMEYALHAVRTHMGMPWRCAMAHTHRGETGWGPGEGNSMWFPTHAADRAHALPWQAPTCAEDVYNTGEWMIYTDGAAYMAGRDAVDRSPDELPDAWIKEGTA